MGHERPIVWRLEEVAAYSVLLRIIAEGKPYLDWLCSSGLLSTPLLETAAVMGVGRGEAAVNQPAGVPLPVRSPALAPKVVLLVRVA